MVLGQTNMTLIRSTSTCEGLGRYEVLDDLHWMLNFCTVCNELMFEFYRCNIVVTKHCSDCLTFVNILEAELPLIDTQSQQEVDISLRQVDCHADCDVCIRKHSIRATLRFILDLHADHQACSHCLTMLNHPESMSMSNDVGGHIALSCSAMSISEEEESEEEEEEGMEFSSELSCTTSDVEFSSSFIYLNYDE